MLLTVFSFDIPSLHFYSWHYYLTFYCLHYYLHAISKKPWHEYLCNFRLWHFNYLWHFYLWHYYLWHFYLWSFTSDIFTSDIFTSDIITSDIFTSDIFTSDIFTSDIITSHVFTPIRFIMDMTYRWADKQNKMLPLPPPPPPWRRVCKQRPHTCSHFLGKGGNFWLFVWGSFALESLEKFVYFNQSREIFRIGGIFS